MRKNRNIIRIIAKLFATFLFLSSFNLYDQIKLEFEWRRDTERIVSITKSDNDSLLYVAFENLISTYNTSDGSLVKNDSVNGTYNLMMSRDGKTLIASTGTGVGI